jgi:hypothetical protein
MNSNKKILQKVRELKTYSNLDLTELESMLEENIREEAVKTSKRKKSELSIIKSLFKDDFYKVRENLKDKTFMDKDFYVYVTGHRVFYTKNDLGYEVVEGKLFNFNFDFLDEYISGRIDLQHESIDVEIDLVELQTFIDTTDKRDLKPYTIKITKGNKVYILGINPRYLMDTIKFTNNNVIKVYLRTNRQTNIINVPIYNAEVDESGLLQKLAVTLPVYIVYNEKMKFNQSVLV